MIAIGTIGTTRLICLDNGLILRFDKHSKKWKICKGYLTEDGYLRINIDRKKYYSHRVLGHAFNILDLHSPLQLDHIDRVRHHNHISNFRPATNQQNQFNRDAKGCYWHIYKKKWHARIKLNRKSIHLGYFDTEQQASQAYQDAKLIYHNIPMP